MKLSAAAASIKKPWFFDGPRARRTGRLPIAFSGFGKAGAHPFQPYRFCRETVRFFCLPRMDTPFPASCTSPASPHGTLRTYQTRTI